MLSTFTNDITSGVFFFADKYSEISEKLTLIPETLIKESKETREMLNETMKTLKEALERLP